MWVSAAKGHTRWLHRMHQMSYHLNLILVSVLALVNPPRTRGWGEFYWHGFPDIEAVIWDNYPWYYAGQDGRWRGCHYLLLPPNRLSRSSIFPVRLNRLSSKIPKSLRLAARPGWSVATIACLSAAPRRLLKLACYLEIMAIIFLGAIVLD